MSINLLNYAYELEKALRNSEEFLQLKDKYDAVLNDANAKSLFDEFRNVQIQLQQKQMTGEEITQEEVQQAQLLAVEIQQNEQVTELMEAEQRMSLAIQELNKIIMKPLEELYEAFMK